MAKAIMIQGTMSNAGKSLLTAGLCRIFKEDGYLVAPFKSQNMALNSFITREGLEMGRAQVVQARAAGTEPSVFMNPVLLKPSSDTGSQIIVNGVPIGHMAARDYFKYKKELIPVIQKAYEKLCEEYEIIVIEGAGSPAEINLKNDDIVNMGMAKMAGAPVLLVGDIDRGGVFAQLYGTVLLLDEEERSYIKGLIINKFRGDKTILDPGVAMIEKLCNIPVTGVTPYMNVDIEDEDSLSSRLENTEIKYDESEEGNGNDGPALVDIAVIRFKRLSNFTDFNVFSCIKGVNVRYVNRVDALGAPDLIILPGTKNTVEDLIFMRQNGIESAILKLAARDVPVFGICGGYQMMGRTLIDEMGTEGGEPGRKLSGMGLFPCTTTFHEEKTRTRVKGCFQPVKGIFSELSLMEAEGYEIHTGETVMDESGLEQEVRSFLKLTQYQQEAGIPGAGNLPGAEAHVHREKTDGMQEHNRYGTYIHGIFDSPHIAETIVKALLIKKGRDPGLIKQSNFDYAAYREEQFDILAAELRKSLDMKKIYEILEAGVCAGAKGETSYDKTGTDIAIGDRKTQL